jgi:hypothetical protein
VEAAGKQAKEQAGNFDLGMEALKGAAVAGERKAVTSPRFGLGEKRKAAASREALIPKLGKTALGERNGESPGALRHGVQCRA